MLVNLRVKHSAKSFSFFSRYTYANIQCTMLCNNFSNLLPVNNSSTHHCGCVHGPWYFSYCSMINNSNLLLSSCIERYIHVWVVHTCSHANRKFLLKWGWILNNVGNHFGENQFPTSVGFHRIATNCPKTDHNLQKRFSHLYENVLVHVSNSKVYNQQRPIFTCTV